MGIIPLSKIGGGRGLGETKEKIEVPQEQATQGIWFSLFI